MRCRPLFRVPPLLVRRPWQTLSDADCSNVHIRFTDRELALMSRSSTRFPVTPTTFRWTWSLRRATNLFGNQLFVESNRLPPSVRNNRSPA